MTGLRETGKGAVSRPLFRPEVLEARQDGALGGVLYVQPLSTRLLTVASVLIAVTLALLLFFGEYTRKARVQGYLVPAAGLIKVYARDTGTIVERHVTEGQRVKSGDVLFVVSLERHARDAVETQATAIAMLEDRRRSLEREVGQQERIARINLQAMRDRADAMEAELDQLSRELSTQQQRVGAATTLLDRYRLLRNESLASDEQIDQKHTDLLEQQGRLEALERTRLGLRREIQTLRSEIAAVQLKAQTQRAATERDVSTIEQTLTEYESRRMYVVTAPADGTATAVLAERGYTTNASQPLVSILPAGAALEAHLLVPSRSVGFIAPGQPVVLRYQAFPHQRFGHSRGRVAEVARTLILPNEVALPLQPTEAAYRITVALDAPSVTAYGREFPLQAGMLLDADISLDRRRLYQWLLDPIYSVVGRV